MRSYLQNQKILDIRYIELALSIITLLVVVYTVVIIVTLLEVRLAVTDNGKNERSICMPMMCGLESRSWQRKCRA